VTIATARITYIECPGIIALLDDLHPLESPWKVARGQVPPTGPGLNPEIYSNPIRSVNTQ